MAFQAKNLSVLAYANGFTLWHYTTEDGAGDVDDAGYFDAAADVVRAGDMILANVDSAGAGGAGIFVVGESAGGTVDVDDITAFGGTDTD